MWYSQILRRVELGLPLEEWGRYGTDEEMGISSAKRALIDNERERRSGSVEKVDVWNNWACDSSVTDIPVEGGQSSPHQPFLCFVTQ